MKSFYKTKEVKKCVIIHLNRVIWVVTACKMVSISMQTVYAYRVQSMRANIV